MQVHTRIHSTGVAGGEQVEMVKNHDQAEYGVDAPRERLTRFTCWMPVGLHRALRRYCAQSGFKMTTVVMRALKEHLKQLGEL